MVLRLVHELLLGEGSTFVMRRSKILRRETSLGGEIPPAMKFSVKEEPAQPATQAETSQDTAAGDQKTTKENNSSESSSESEDDNL